MKIKWKNITLAIILVACVGLLGRDIYYVFIRQWFTSEFASLTWLGLIIDSIVLCISISIILYFMEEMEEMEK